MDVIAFLPGDGLRSTGRVDEVLPLIVDRVFHFNFQRQIPNVLAVTQFPFRRREENQGACFFELLGGRFGVAGHLLGLPAVPGCGAVLGCSSVRVGGVTGWPRRLSDFGADGGATVR